LGDQIEKNEMDRACSMFGGEGRYIQSCGGINLREDPGIDRRIILRWIFRKWDGDMNCVDLTQDRYR
jgi:hypothetical protein